MSSNRADGRRKQRDDAMAITAKAINLLVGLAFVFAFASTSASASTLATPTLAGHRLLVDQSGLRVYGPSQRVGVPCPRLLPLPADALATVKRAVALAMPPFEKQVKFDGRDPIVKVAPASRSGFNYLAGGCGRAVWKRSIVAFVRLPHITFSASLSQDTFAVGRVSQGWVLWGYIH